MARKKIERNISYDEERKRYYVNLDYGADPETGKQIKRTKTFEKLSQARSALRQHEADRDRGVVVIPKELTLAQWLNTWMSDVISLSRAETTVYAYRNMIDKHIVPILGQIPLQKLTPQQLQKYYADKIHSGLTSNTVRKHHDLLNAALKVAVRQGLLMDNPAGKVETPKLKRPEIHYYSLEELQTLFQLVEGTRLEVLVKLAGLLGLRREEIMGLTWDCVDFQRQIITITNVRTSAGTQVVSKAPKTETSHRVLYMPEELTDVLHRERPGQQHLKFRQKDLEEAVGVKGGGKAFFLQTDFTSKVGMFTECKSRLA